MNGLVGAAPGGPRLMCTLPRQPLSWLLDRSHLAASRPLAAADVGCPAVVFAPHQDDETLGCGGLVACKRRLGADVDVVFLTDGTGSHPRFIDAATLADRRRTEAVAACGVLGVPEARVHFLAYRDQELASCAAAAEADVAVRLRRWSGRQILVPYAYDVTPDHVATRRIVRAACAAVLAPGAPPWVILEYAVWFWHHWPCVPTAAERRRRFPAWLADSLRAGWRRHRDLRHRLGLTDVQAVKRAALERHASQMQRPAAHPDWPVLADVAQGHWLERCLGRSEFFRRTLCGSGDRVVADPADGRKRRRA